MSWYLRSQHAKVAWKQTQVGDPGKGAQGGRWGAAVALPSPREAKVRENTFLALQTRYPASGGRCSVSKMRVRKRRVGHGGLMATVGGAQAQRQETREKVDSLQLGQQQGGCV